MKGGDIASFMLDEDVIQPGNPIGIIIINNLQMFYKALKKFIN